MAHDPYGRPVRRDYGSPWNWIIGIAAILILGIIVWAAVGGDTNVATKDTATESSPATTTGSAPKGGTTGSAPGGTTDSAPKSAPTDAGDKNGAK